MKPGQVAKCETTVKLILERKTLGTISILTLNRDCCIGCNICTKACPQEAIAKLKTRTQDQGHSSKAVIDIDAGRCLFCGICVVLCPSNAIEILKNGRQTVPVVEADAFPNLLKEIMVDIGKCEPSCGLICAESCPTKAINVTIEKEDDGKVTRISSIDVNKRKCIFCSRCESKCPKMAIHVLKPIQGFLRLDGDLCPTNCKICAEVCPTGGACLAGDGKLRIEKEFCIYCGSCQEACPKNAIRVERTRVLHTSVNSGAWLKTMERLISHPYVEKESSARSLARLRDLVKNTNQF